MFVKKDLRKIPQILADATSRAVASPPSSPPDPADPSHDSGGGGDRDVVEEIRFARRAPEFLPSCGVSLVLSPRYRPALENLVQLSLYDCGLSTLAGIEESSSSSSSTTTPLFPRLTSLDIGRNPKLTNDSLPETFHSQFPELLQLWSDDCGFGPDVPSTVLELHKLQVVRMTGNRLEGELESGIGIRHWKSVRVLALDGNRLSGVGRGVGRLTCLEKLHLRGNSLTTLPEGVPSRENYALAVICLSSNRLTSVPVSLVDAGAILKELYLNGNRIEEVPEGLAEKLVGLKKLNLAHNSIGEGAENATAGSQSSTNGDDDGDVAMEDAGSDCTAQLPRDFVDRFGMPEPLTGRCTKDECVVRMEGNPLAETIRKKYLDEEKRKAKEMAMETAAE